MWRTVKLEFKDFEIKGAMDRNGDDKRLIIKSPKQETNIYFQTIYGQGKNCKYIK